MTPSHLREALPPLLGVSLRRLIKQAFFERLGEWGGAGRKTASPHKALGLQTQPCTCPGSPLRQARSSPHGAPEGHSGRGPVVCSTEKPPPTPQAEGWCSSRTGSEASRVQGPGLGSWQAAETRSCLL